MKRWQYLDPILMITIALIAAIGVIAIGSASLSVSEKINGSPFNFLTKHLIYWVLALVGAALVFSIKIELWEKYAKVLFILSLPFLLLVFVPGLGVEMNYSRRWIGFAGFTLQPSEFVKFAWVLYLAAYVAKEQANLKNGWESFSRPLVLLGLVMVILLFEPDFGTAAVLMTMTMGVLFLAGAHLLQFIYLTVIAVLGLIALAVIEPYRFARITSFLNPWESVNAEGYQLVQSLIAFGRGEWWGVGIGQSIQKHLYLPEAHTDFVYAIWSEETGLLGNLLLIVLFSFLIFRLFRLAQQTEAVGWLFKSHVVFGITLLFALQAVINMGMCMGALPTKGLTLPFVSYGGSSLLVSAAMMAMVFRIQTDLRVYQQQVGGAHA